MPSKDKTDLIIVVNPGERDVNTLNLTKMGSIQVRELGISIKESLGEIKPLIISSESHHANQSAQIISNCFGVGHGVDGDALRFNPDLITKYEKEPSAVIIVAGFSPSTVINFYLEEGKFLKKIIFLS